MFIFRDKFNPEIPGIILFRELLMVHTHQPAHTQRQTTHTYRYKTTTNLIPSAICRRIITVNVHNAFRESLQFAWHT